MLQLHKLAIFTRNRFDMVPQGSPFTAVCSLFVLTFDTEEQKEITGRNLNKKEQSVNFICCIQVPTGANIMLRILRVLAYFRGMY